MKCSLDLKELYKRYSCGSGYALLATTRQGSSGPVKQEGRPD